MGGREGISFAGGVSNSGPVVLRMALQQSRLTFDTTKATPKTTKMTDLTKGIETK